MLSQPISTNLPDILLFAGISLSETSSRQTVRTASFDYPCERLMLVPQISLFNRLGMGWGRWKLLSAASGILRSRFRRASNLSKSAFAICNAYPLACYAVCAVIV
ncbi:protein of unknown function [Hyphomicrobium sp. MC1]|nr:protein of unknown function [Hyphomicrobium sp. MC1]